jgi:hypothetical protein
VDRYSAISQLPETHAVAIRLRDDGFDHRVIALALAIDEQLVPMLLRIADSKLARLINGHGPGSKEGGLR